jgi:hypothetical protein
MKKCPQCLSLYADETKFCLNDGQFLIPEVMPLPSEAHMPDEEITIVRNEPMVVDLSSPGVSDQFAPHAASEKTLPYQIQNVPAASRSSSAKYLVFLIIGLLLGGGLVLAGLFLTKSFYPANGADNRQATTVNSNQAQNRGDSKNSDSETNKNSETNKPVTASAEHRQKTDEGDEEFNGRVITLNAYIRSSPSRNAAEIDVLPIDDRLTITARDNPNSAWFHVVCEHGTSGWMHGNTIEYTR